MISWREREAQNEVRFRDQNEWIEKASDSFGGFPLTETYVCECGDGACTETIELTRAEYESVRSEPTHFVLAPNHENPEVESVVAESSRFAVVDKFEALARRIALAADPRSHGRRGGVG
jgi:hypothetical protein